MLLAWAWCWMLLERGCSSVYYRGPDNCCGTLRNDVVNVQV